MRLLLLAGSGEARVLSRELAAMQGVEVIASLAGATRAPARLEIPTRTGGFGGEAEQEEYLKNKVIEAVVDATHPFAAHISQRTAMICARLNIPYLQVLRPEWVPTAADNWVMIGDEAEAASHIPVGARVFLATGRQTLAQFSNLAGRHLICRQIDPPEGDFPFNNGQYLIGKPPFSEPDERELFRRLRVDWLVVKNAGGVASFTKLEAARALKIPVAMIRRPEQPEGDKAGSVEAALDWVRARL
ncbi:cobalt-precorrin-6A reductase [Pseudogemmobacter sp. W21_MBD1_M6]|uniref:cobalt-precorrin-6A reductase n=1 Tax=Pseudogemmobacter sp. W21_MBD1_M6 TaxID=3240271 RepID=UPI003F972CC5